MELDDNDTVGIHGNNVTISESLDNAETSSKEPDLCIDSCEIRTDISNSDAVSAITQTSIITPACNPGNIESHLSEAKSSITPASHNTAISNETSTLKTNGNEGENYTSESPSQITSEASYASNNKTCGSTSQIRIKPHVTLDPTEVNAGENETTEGPPQVNLFPHGNEMSIPNNESASARSHVSPCIISESTPAPASTKSQQDVPDVSEPWITSSFMEHPTSEDVLTLIPSKIQQGFRTVNVKIVCMDASKSHLLFGSDAGCGFLFNRETGGFTKILSESRTDVITSVKLFIGIEIQIAFGTEDGKLTIIVISLFSTDSAKQVNKYALGTIHSSEVTCMEWSSNGMKLFTGDNKGNIYCAERDFEKNNCSVMLIRTEDHSIVDLSYKHMILLISTTERTLLFHTNTGEIKPVGSKPRQGRFGSCFSPDSISSTDLKVFSARPGYRIWISDVSGQVTNTLVLKDLVSSFTSNIQMDTEQCDATHKDPQFRKLVYFQGRYLLASSDSSFFLIDPNEPSIVAGSQDVKDILDIVTTTDELFILCKNRKLHRIAEKPDDLAMRRKWLSEEEKKREGQSKNLMEVKESLTEIKKNFSPLVGALQSGMSSLNEGAGQWSQKLQSQAKSFQMKLPKSLFTREGKNSQLHAEQPQLMTDLGTDSSMSADSATTSTASTIDKSQPKEEDIDSTKKKDCVVMSVYESTNLNPDAMKEIFDNKSNDNDFLHSQGNSQMNDNMNKPPQPVKFHFDKLDKISADDGAEIVFVSKRKKKSRSASGSKDSKQKLFHQPEDGLTTSDLHSSKSEINIHVAKKNAGSEVKEKFAQLPKVKDQSSEANDEDCSLTMNEIVDFRSVDQKHGKVSKKFPHNRKPTEFKSKLLGVKFIGVSEAEEVKSESSKVKGGTLGVKADASEVKVGSLVVKGDSSEVGVDSLEVKPDASEVKCDSSEVKDDSSEVKDDSSEVKVDSLEVNVYALKVKAGNLEVNAGASEVNDDYSEVRDEFSEINGGFSEIKDVTSNLDNDENLIRVMLKTTGNQLCSKIIKTPNINDAGFDFSLPVQTHLGVTVDKKEENEVDLSIAGNIISQNSDNENLFKWVMGSKPQDQPETDDCGTLESKDTRNKFLNQNPLFSDSECSIDQDYCDDIYAVDRGERDFESEIETDSDVSNDEEVMPILQKQVSTTSSTHSFTSYEVSAPVRLLDSWSSTTLPHHAVSMGGSDCYIWYIDYYNHIYITEDIYQDNFQWKKLAQKGVQLSISPCGSVAWLISNSGKLYATSMPVELHLMEEPVELNWQLVGSGESLVTLGHDSAWVVSSSGNVKVQFGISRSNPFSKSWDLVQWNKERITHITSTRSTIWCRTEPGNIFAAELSDIDDVDFEWERIDSSSMNSSTIQSITSDNVSVLFAVDSEGILWFLSEDRKWWQVNISEYVDEDRQLVSHSVMQSLPTKVQRWIAGLVRVKHVGISMGAIWIICDKEKASIARGPLTGHRWNVTPPLGVVKSSKWKHITTSSVFSPDHGAWVGLVWACRSNDEIFCFPSQDVATVHPMTLAPPVFNKTSIVCMSASKETLWVLFSDGMIYIRSGISAECLDGTEWNKLDTSEQLGPVKLVHVSCGTQNVWAVDTSGGIYFRIGVTATDRHSLPHAWIPIDGCNVSGSYLTQIECGLSDGSVWALDNFSNIYVRTGVTYDMSVGEGWEQVPGSHAQQLCISNHTVWGLRTGGDIINRHGISERNVIGNYWKNLRGDFKKIAATPYDELWAIDRDQHLRYHYTTTYCPVVVVAGTSDIRKDWEFV